MDVLHYAAFPDGDDGGNPAAVVLGAEHLAAGSAQEIAARLGYSETAFVGATNEDGSLPLRYFSPQAEVRFCGHATIATAVVLAEQHGLGTYRFHTGAGVITVRTDRHDGGTLATLTSPQSSSVPASDREIGATLRALGWSAHDLDSSLPVHVASAGERHLILPAASRQRLAALDYDFESLRAVMVDRGWTTVHVTWRERDNRWHARDPFPVGGVVEDPATGAAAAAFGGYLRATGLVSPPFSLEILQGTDMGVPCRILVDLPEGTSATLVSGTARRLEYARATADSG